MAFTRLTILPRKTYTMRTQSWRPWIRQQPETQPARHSPAKPRRSAAARQRRLFFEPLEARRVLAYAAELAVDVTPGSGSTAFHGLTQTPDHLLFLANQQPNLDVELWSLAGRQGTIGGPVGTLANTPSGRPYFTAPLGGNFLTLYAGLNQPVRDVSGTTPFGVTAVLASPTTETVFFASANPVSQVWQTRGTPETTSVFAGLYRDPGHLTLHDGKLFFTAIDMAPTNATGRELWVLGASGPELYANINQTFNGSSSPFHLTSTSLGLMYSANDGIHGRELYLNDTLVKDIVPPGYDPANDPSPLEFTDVGGAIGEGTTVGIGGTVYFTVDDGSGRRLWKTDGTEAGTVKVRDSSGASHAASYLTRVNGTLFFLSDDGIHGSELWKTNGTPAGTVMVKDIGPGSEGSYASQLFNNNGILLFAARDSAEHGYELWRSDGTAAGTWLALDINPMAARFRDFFARCRTAFISWPTMACRVMNCWCWRRFRTCRQRSPTRFPLKTLSRTRLFLSNLPPMRSSTRTLAVCWNIRLG